MEETKELTIQEPNKSTAGRKSIPLSLLKERRKYEVSLKLTGLSTSAIQKQVNSQATVKGWGTVGIATINKDIAHHYSKTRVIETKDFDYMSNLREAMLAQMEVTMEKMSIHIIKNKSWKPFQYEDALEKLHKMQMDYVEIQNWNLSKKNIMNFIQNNINTVYDEGSRELRKAPPEAIQKLAGYLDEVIEKIEKGVVEEEE
jgi:dihydroorotate dehydrogenase